MEKQQSLLFAEELISSEIVTYYLDHGNIKVIESGHIRLVKNNKENYVDFAYIDPTTKELAISPLNQIVGDTVSVIRSYRDPKTKQVLSEHYFDFKMKPTLCHGYHQAHYQYYFFSPNKKASKCFMDTQGNSTTLLGSNIARCEYIYPLLFPYMRFIFFFDAQGKQIDLIQKNVKIRAILYDFTPNLYLDRPFPYNIRIYCSEGTPCFFHNFNPDQRDFFLDALL